MGDKYTHTHILFRERITDFLLFIRAATLHSIIFYRPETHVVGIIYLVDKILSCLVTEHAIMKGIIEVKRLVPKSCDIFFGSAIVGSDRLACDNRCSGK